MTDRPGPMSEGAFALRAMINAFDDLVVKVICHPDRADAFRTALAGRPLVRVVASEFVPTVDTVYVFDPRGGLS